MAQAAWTAMIMVVLMGWNVYITEEQIKPYIDQACRGGQMNE